MTDPLAEAIHDLAASIERLSISLQSAPVAPTPPSAGPGGPPPPGGPTQPPGGSGGTDRQVKMGKKVFAICAQNGWDIADVGGRALGRPIGGDSRKWSMDELTQVLDTFKEWGYN